MTRPLSGLRIGLLTASASRLGGGVFEAVVNQAAMIRALGGEVSVFALEDEQSEADSHRFAGCKLSHSRIVGPAQIGYAPGLTSSLLSAELDCLHLHGIWMYPSRAATLWARQTGRNYIISPHGMLDPTTVNRRPWKKFLGKIAYERASWRSATLFHALTDCEAANIARQVGLTATVKIPNAGPPAGGPATSLRAPTVSYLGRIHAIKNLDSLIEGWCQARLPKAARLVIAGWGDSDDVARLKARIAAAGPSVEFVGPAYGADKRALLEGARFMVLASHSEAMPMAVLEGWAAGTPTIMTASCNLPEGFAAGAAIACGHGPVQIAAALEQALALDEAAWLAMSRAAGELACGPFSSEVVAAAWAAAYRRAMSPSDDVLV